MAKNDDRDDITITVQAVTKRGDQWAEFVAGEVARLLDDLCAFQVQMQGDFVLTNDHKDRVWRFKQIAAATRADLKLGIEPRSRD